MPPKFPNLSSWSSNRLNLKQAQDAINKRYNDIKTQTQDMKATVTVPESISNLSNDLQKNLDSRLQNFKLVSSRTIPVTIPSLSQQQQNLLHLDTKVRNALQSGINYSKKVSKDNIASDNDGGKTQSWTEKGTSIMKQKAYDAGNVIKDKASDAGNVIKDKASDVGNVIKDKSLDVSKVLKDKTLDYGNSIKDKTVDYGNSIKDKTVGYGNSIKDKTYDYTNSLKKQSLDYGNTLKDKTINTVSDYSTTLKNKTVDASNSIKDKTMYATTALKDKTTKTVSAAKDKTTSTITTTITSAKDKTTSTISSSINSIKEETARKTREAKEELDRRARLFYRRVMMLCCGMAFCFAVGRSLPVAFFGYLDERERRKQCQEREKEERGIKVEGDESKKLGSESVSEIDSKSLGSKSDSDSVYAEKSSFGR